MKKGIYFLANDDVYELCVAFLNSLRISNPEWAVCLIPYNENCAKVQNLQNSFNFSIFADEALLARCDEISRSFYPRAAGEFRKLAMWSGPFDRFIYIDVDTLVLGALEPIVELLSSYEVVSANSNIESTRRWTWKDSAIRESGLRLEQLNYAANTGFLASSKNTIDPATIDRALQGAVDIRHHMVELTMEQPFLNYLFVTSGKRYTSLTLLRQQEQLKHLPHEAWPGDPNWTVSDSGTMAYNGEVLDVLFIHWSGLWSSKPSHRPLTVTDDEGALHVLPHIREELALKELWAANYLAGRFRARRSASELLVQS